MSKHIPYNSAQREREMQLVRKTYQAYKKAKELGVKVQEMLANQEGLVSQEDKEALRKALKEPEYE